ncbi:TatD family hydrolase [Psychrobacter sp. 16-MNA-CIBAN-0192]|uniref:TatD family hydrolase n=1 Tax=Psychrobacter sp. 16-MNA-CIBAN-0192 TaxID=3140448 RepID=UPI0033201C8A
MILNTSLEIKDDTSLLLSSKWSATLPLIDTHTHFDAPVFDADRMIQAQQAYGRGVRHLILVGYVARHFERLYETQRLLAQQKIIQPAVPQTHIAVGLHPFYSDQHTEEHLSQMAQLIQQRRPLAIGEIGLDTFTAAMKQPHMLAKQQYFFKAQLDMAVQHQLPVMLHIRKAHAEALALIKAHDYDAQVLGGIAHSFSGGEQEAKAFVKLGFKLGVTGQITNPNAKKLRRAICAAVAEYGVKCLVIETDCPDMTPVMCQTSSHHASALGQDTDNEWHGAEGHNRNVPSNLPWVLLTLSELLDIAPADLARQLWQNSCDALQVDWDYLERYDS